MQKHQPTLSLYLENEIATNQLGADLAIALKGGMVVFLEGDLGAGKTTLARAIIRQLFGDKEHEVPSPTYSLVQSYEGLATSGISTILHSDLYRISDPQEIDELGLKDTIDDQVILVEWPQNAGDELKPPDLTLTLSEQGEGRKLDIAGNCIDTIKRSLLIRSFLDMGWEQDITREKLFGDASTRSYEKVSNAQTTHILMNAPRQPDGPVLRDGKPYSQLAHLAEDVSAFVGVQKILDEAGLCAPKIHAENLSEGLLLLEDLGTQTIIDEKRNPISERYIKSVQMLAEFHEKPFQASAQLSNGSSHAVPKYSREAMLIEAELLLDWYAPRMKGKPLLDSEKAEFISIWNMLIDQLEKSEPALVLRDYHSPNIIWLPEREGIKQIGVIDFQDAVIGPSAYDVASLAQDARIDISAELENKLVDAYIGKRISTKFDANAFKQDYAIMAAQRATKILGIFIRLDERDGKSAYLKHLPRMQNYIARCLEHPVLSNYKHWYNSVMQ